MSATEQVVGTSMRERVIDALRTVHDPEIPVNIHDLGLIYALEIDEEAGDVRVLMTLTTPGCPVAQSFPATVTQVVEQVDGVHNAEVELVWDPPWDKSRMTEAARLQLGLM